MSRQVNAFQTLAVLPEQIMVNGQPKATGKVFVALVPNEEFQKLCDDLDQKNTDLRETLSSRQQLVTSGEVRTMSAECAGCNLCLVCAGKHRTYSKDFNRTWPPGQDRCFVNMTKSGRPLRDEPCKLCDTHDELLRRSEGDRRRSISAASKLKTEIQRIKGLRSLMFEEFAVDSYQFRG